MSEQTTEEIHQARLANFEKLKKMGQFSADFQEDSEKFVEHQLKRVGKSQSRVPFRAAIRDKRRKREWADSLENLPGKCDTLNEKECGKRTDCFLSAYKTTDRGVETNFDLVKEDGGFKKFICKNIYKLEPVQAFSNTEMGKIKRKTLLKAKRIASMDDPRNILKNKLIDNTERRIIRGETKNGGNKTKGKKERKKKTRTKKMRTKKMRMKRMRTKKMRTKKMRTKKMRTKKIKRT